MCDVMISAYIDDVPSAHDVCASYRLNSALISVTDIADISRRNSIYWILLQAHCVPFHLLSGPSLKIQGK